MLPSARIVIFAVVVSFKGETTTIEVIKIRKSNNTALLAMPHL
jgi:hypothetical protein